MLILPTIYIIIFFFHLPVAVVDGDPQTNLLSHGCSMYNASNPSLFPSVLNSTLSDLSSQLNNNQSSLFATSQHPHSSDPLYALFFCRDYLSPKDCHLCFSSAVANVHTCGLDNNGARATLDGCFLRYETLPFFDQGTQNGNTAVCGNRTSLASGYSAAVDGLMADLATVTPKVDGYFAAAERGGVYAVAQCARTVSRSVCGDCLAVAYGNMKECLPDVEGRAVDAGCFMRFSDVKFFGDYKVVDIGSLLNSGGSSHKWTIIGGVVGGVGGLLLLSLVVLLWIRTSRKPENAHRGNILGATELRGPVNFHYRDLKSATKNFSEENKLGGGGFGDVYKGTLRNGTVVAVKKLAIAETSRARADFQSEVKLISNLHHRNLVRLLGCSSKGLDFLLVYEYMANNSLDKFLFGDQRGTLNWKQRFDIIVGMARGLAYLHQDFHACVIHRDIKSSNVLLDDDFQPKIADFGLARLLPGDQSHLSTRFAGTLGYTAPEYAIHGQLSEKVDTYGYGVVVLEIISGRKANDVNLELETQYLLQWAWGLYENDDSIRLIDESLNKDEYNTEEVKRTIQIALLCTQSTAAARPTMSEVVLMLLSRVGPMTHPSRPIFIDATRTVRADTSNSTGSSSASNATFSLTQFSAR